MQIKYLFLLLFSSGIYSQHSFAQDCCYSNVDVIVNFSLMTFLDFTERSSTAPCDEIPFTNSAQPCNGGCSDTDSQTSNDDCYLIQITITVDGCPEEKIDWIGGCSDYLSVPTGVPFLLQFSYLEPCSNCNPDPIIPNSAATERGVFVSYGTYEFDEGSSNNTIGSLEFSYLYSHNFFCD
jgi:hypothetical protein